MTRIATIDTVRLTTLSKRADVKLIESSRNLSEIACFRQL